MRETDFDALTGKDIRRLLENQVPESRTLDYKRMFWKEDRDGTKEFLADVGSFANTQGGDIVIGIDEACGLPTALPGVALPDADGKILSLENQLRDRIEPRIHGIRMRRIEIDNGVDVLVIRIPSSLMGPHRDKSTGRFYARNSAGKYEMDVQELRDAFLGGEQLAMRLRHLHKEAIEAPGTDKIAFSVVTDAVAVVSVVPLDVFRARRDLDITSVDAVAAYWPMSGSRNWSIVLEGVIWTALSQDSLVNSYTLTHRTGRVDAIWAIGGNRSIDGRTTVSMVFAPSFERGLTDIVTSTHSKLRSHGVEGPWMVQTSLIGIAGTRLSNSQPTFRRCANLPDIIKQEITEADLIPVFRAFWRVFGLERPSS